jgi:hypothetical protein
MARFLTAEELVDLFLAELPKGMFSEDRADDADPAKRSISSSEIRVMMQLLADLYSNLEAIYDDKFVTTLSADGARRWEREVFPFAVDSSQPLSIRRANILTKLRATGGISLFIIDSIVNTIVSVEGLGYEIVTWSGFAQSSTEGAGAWVFEEGLLDRDTYLTATDPILGAQIANPLDCSLDYAAAGLTLDQLQGIQATAYTYEIRILGNASTSLLARLDDQLTQYEPARSTHYVFNNFPGPVAH